MRSYKSSSLLEARSFHPQFVGSMSVTQIFLSPNSLIKELDISSNSYTYRINSDR